MGVKVGSGKPSLRTALWTKAVSGGTHAEGELGAAGRRDEVHERQGEVDVQRLPAGCQIH